MWRAFNGPGRGAAAAFSAARVRPRRHSCPLQILRDTTTTGHGVRRPPWLSYWPLTSCTVLHKGKQGSKVKVSVRHAGLKFTEAELIHNGKIKWSPHWSPYKGLFWRGLGPCIKLDWFLRSKCGFGRFPTLTRIKFWKKHWISVIFWIFFPPHENSPVLAKNICYWQLHSNISVSSFSMKCTISWITGGVN